MQTSEPRAWKRANPQQPEDQTVTLEAKKLVVYLHVSSRSTTPPPRTFISQPFLSSGLALGLGGGGGCCCKSIVSRCTLGTNRRGVKSGDFQLRGEVFSICFMRSLYVIIFSWSRVK